MFLFALFDLIPKTGEEKTKQLNLTSKHQMLYVLKYENDTYHRRRCCCPFGTDTQQPEAEFQITGQRGLTAWPEGDGNSA
jgi:hypothetical protein